VELSVQQAAEYLARARAGFERAHGKNLERLQGIKGDAAEEKAL
jgi:hypothetical protein